MTEFHPTERDLHTKAGRHRKRPPAGLTEDQKRRWISRSTAHQLRHDLEVRRPMPPDTTPIKAGEVVSTHATDELLLIRDVCGRPLGRQFADLMKLRGISQRVMAQELGITRTALEFKIGGTNAFSLAEGVYLAHRLGVRLEDLVAHLVKAVHEPG